VKFLSRLLTALNRFLPRPSFPKDRRDAFDFSAGLRFMDPELGLSLISVCAMIACRSSLKESVLGVQRRTRI
jgi:hypothetical protein